MRNIITVALSFVIVLIVAGLLVKNRLDTAPIVQAVESIRWFDEDPNSGTCPEFDGQHITACHRFEEFAVGDDAIAMESPSTLTIDGEHLRFETGRVLIDGNVTLTVRDISVTTHGVVTLVHYSWLNKLDVKVLDGSADIRQGEYSSTVTTNNAVGIDTLPPYSAIAPTVLNTAAIPFYEWALR